ncbi:hypothetical protein [Brevundimonas sp. NIBR11]|uniref:hypothetical protein n=1 Tax=Brevundimonas sp. NIBR11 TaxID=3015999 RepID=UPI0022F0B135|nr:hypothetical protein [Brevundimonas sp. NIBR11]WGM29833.1 hypothetical protein KKHFBJBL_00035 [Brevundimonas sp. NIBR11]
MSQHPLARYGAVLGVCGLAGMGAGLVAGIVTATSDQTSWGSAALIAAAVALAMTSGLWASLRWWKGLDEAAQEAHKWAWWWGATVGGCFAGVILLTLLHGVGELGEAPFKSTLMLGAAIVIGFQLVGYGVAWAVWWLKRR